MDKTTIETMEMVTSANVDNYEALTKQRGRLNITPSNPHLFTYGTIIEDPEQISSEGEYTFCVFRVGIGKSFCHKKEADEGFENIPLREGYDSTYLENSHNSKVFKMDYIIYSSENVLLTHVIKCKIDVQEYQASHREQICKVCLGKADFYCENDDEYFCAEDDEKLHENENNIHSDDQLAKTMQELRAKHIRVPIQDAKLHKFGNCAEHPKKQNEYYDRLRNKAFCTMCAIDMAQGKKDGQNNLVSLDHAYSVAKQRAENPDAALEQRKAMIKQQMDQIAQKIEGIKKQSQAAQNKITEMVEEALK